MPATPIHTARYAPLDPLSAVVLRNEARRTSAAVAVLLIGSAAAGLVALVLRPGHGADVGRLAPLALSWIALLLAFEVAIHVRVRRMIGQDLAPRPWIWFASGLIEIAAPSVALLVLSQAFPDPAVALDAPLGLLYFPLLALSVLRLNAALCLTLGLAGAAGYAVVAYALLAEGPGLDPGSRWAAGHASTTLGIALTGAACAFVASALRARTAEAIRTATEKERLRTLFGQHTDPAIVQALLDGGRELETGKRQRVVALFLDVRGFTAFAESRPPEEVVAYLNALFEVAVGAVVRSGGVVHQLLGDGLLALFGVPDARPDDADRAVRAALDTAAEVAAAVEAGALPPTRLGIGLHAGEGLVGLVGPAGHREYKVTGDAVNVAARVEQMNKDFDSEVLATSAVTEALTAPPPMTDMGPVDVRGRREAVRVFRLL